MSKISKTLISEKELRFYYLHKKLTDIQIASLFNCSKVTVYKTRKKYGIEAIQKYERKDFSVSRRQEHIIYGTLMGDGCIEKDLVNKNKNACLSIKHSINQKEYVDWKFNELKNLCNLNPKEINGRYRFRTFNHPYFSDLREKFYSKKKTIKMDILNKLSPLSVAVWFCDDGTNLCNATVLRFSTCCFSKEEHILMIDWFNGTYNIKCNFKNYSGYNMLAIDKTSRKNFLELIREHVPDCMKRKVASKWEY